MSSGIVRWVDGLPSGQQAIVVGLLLLIVPAVFSAAWWAVRRGLRRARDRRAEARRVADAERQRLSPQPRIGLVQTLEVEPVALAAVSDIVARMQTAQAKFARQAAAIRPQTGAGKVSTGRLKQMMGENARALDRYSDEIREDTKQFKKALQGLSDSWSSRMYWHDKRGSANDILNTQTPAVIRPLLELTRRTMGVYANQEALEGLSGWTRKLDQSVDRHRKLRLDLVQALQEFETTLPREQMPVTRPVVAPSTNWAVPVGTPTPSLCCPGEG
jgi:hypothetical protein